MKIKAAVLGGVGQDWEVREIELGDPVANEVQVKLTASGLCHSDEHLRTGASPVPFFPVIVAMKALASSPRSAPE